MSELDTSINAVEGLANFYEYLWGDTEGWVYLPTKDPATDDWTKTLFEWPKHKKFVIQHTLVRSGEGKEVYVAPALFKEARPVKENALGSNVLWVEFDGNAPVQWTPAAGSSLSEAPTAPEPSLRINSSREGHEHCYWKLGELNTDIDFIENTNRALAYSLKADTSGWDINQVLRPPFTTNYKHDLPVTIAGAKAVSYSRPDFKNFKEVKQLVSQNIEITDIPAVTYVVAKYPWDDHHYDLFMKPKIEEGKRSSALMALGFFGAESGMTDEEIYSILLNADDRWLKFKNRNDRQRRLLDIINRARQKYPVGVNTTEGLIRGLLSDETKVETDTKYVYGWTEFNNTEVVLEWAIEGLLEKGGMGVLVSGPGIGKTQLSLQFAISCCLGREWLHWKVSKRMKVLWLSLEMNLVALKHFTTTIAQGYSEAENEELQRNLKIFPIGEPLPLDHPEGRKTLEALIEEYKPDGIVIDSMGKVSNASLSDEEKIKSLNAYYAGLRRKYGVFLWFIHHNRKANSENKKPTALDDIYGNQYIAAETSVALNLWKLSGGRIEVTELKNRLSPQGPPFIIKRGEHLKFIPAEEEHIGIDGLMKDTEKDEPSPSKSTKPPNEDPLLEF